MLDRLTPVEVEPDRPSHILAAAERAFARHGFHGASMQTIAAEARMSAGNLYRYFDCKEAIVFGLVARDQVTIARDFHELAVADDLLSALGIVLRRLLVDAPIERHQMILEIWAEASRNPAIASHCSTMDRELRARLVGIVERARSRGRTAADIDPAFVVRVMATMVAGLFKRRATDPSFDGEAELALALGVVRATLDGAVLPHVTTDSGTSS